MDKLRTLMAATSYHTHTHTQVTLDEAHMRVFSSDEDEDDGLHYLPAVSLFYFLHTSYVCARFVVPLLH